MTNWLTAGEPFDAVFANNDEMAIGAIQAMKSAGVDMTKVIVVGVDATQDCLAEMQAGGLRCKDWAGTRDGPTLPTTQAERPNRRLIKRTSVPPPTASIHKLNWPFLNIRMTSKPLIVARAVRIDWKPSVGRIRRLSLLWSPSSRLFRYLTCRCSSSLGIAPSLFSAAIASP